MASDLPYMLTTSILDSSIFTFTYPSKYLPECLLSIWNNIFSKTNSWFLTNPQLHPATLSSILQTSSYQSLSSWVAQNNLPFTHSALPTKSSLMFFKQTKEHLTSRPLCSLMSLPGMPFALKSTCGVPLPSPSTSLLVSYFIYSSGSEVRDKLEDLDWQILPIFLIFNWSKWKTLTKIKTLLSSSVIAKSHHCKEPPLRKKLLQIKKNKQTNNWHSQPSNWPCQHSSNPQ